MTKTLVHEVRTYQRLGADGSPWFAACRCGWLGGDKGAEESARIEGKDHRLSTAVEDDVNAKFPMHEGGRR